MPAPFRLDRRAAGLLLHPTSLPGPHGSGDLGHAAREFVDLLAAAGLRWWQMLPIGPPGPGNSPYSAYSALAGSPLLISLDLLAERGLLERRDLRPDCGLRTERVAYPAVRRFRFARLRRAFAGFVHGGGLQTAAFRRFVARNSGWLDDFALFIAIKDASGNREWLRWPAPLRLRRLPDLARARQRLAAELDFQRFCQFEFARQWAALRRYARRRGVGLIGDIPIFVAHDSADVWAHRELFQLDAGGRPRVVSGVPPDYFSRTGQLWGHPHYRWRRHQATGFAWWMDRFQHAFRQFDAVRIDHFLGFYRCWAVPGRARTARRGRWLRTPGRELFEQLRSRLGRVEIIAEDLGLVTRQATALRDRYGWPGMRVLQFAFGSDQGHYHEPHAYPRRCVVYTGTHDNDTTVGWFRKLGRAGTRPGPRAGPDQLERVLRYVGSTGREIHWDMIRLALMSVADLAVVPVQDLLGLDSRARMNRPGTARGNWEWRLPAGALTDALARRLRDLLAAYGRLKAGDQA